eukprot:TRINITY_DN8268_c0_g1_i5.p1 TRINITY_DN8268_c0_g1~~TRINITY_DN8268_c0_g1_i5.p1  ORF type:complete len:183 (-),score=42.28 TRINITY_DN8268_c0_g1_i5:192-740(-)
MSESRYYDDVDQSRMNPTTSKFTYTVFGQVESAKMDSADCLFCKIEVVHGPDWSLVEGIKAAITQMSQRSSSDSRIVWNFPLEMSFQSTNPYGWPKLVLTTHTRDAFGREVVNGYGWTHLPISPGRFVHYIPLFKPMSSSSLQRFANWFIAITPEYVKPDFITSGEGRESKSSSSTTPSTFR